MKLAAKCTPIHVANVTTHLMKYCRYILIALILISCNPFQKDRVMNYNSELMDIFKIMQEYNNVTLEIDSDDRLAEKMQDLGIDYIVKNTDRKNIHYSGFTEENDSLLIFIKKSQNLLVSEKRIIYDFSKKPRNFGNDTIVNASYKIIQINNRWYFSIVAFD